MWGLREEAFGILALVGISALHPAGLSRLLSRGERTLRGLAQHRFLGPASIAVLAVALCAIDAALHGMPLPVVHDEFSYLLAADTFAHGRLSNPTHPMWHYLEEFHVLQEPTRASKYPPGMGLVLALGTVGFGHPIVGVWIVMGLACAATAWALRGVLPPYWAWLGGMLLAANPMMHLWGMDYWGGSLSLLGGALAFGAFLRLRARPAAGNALIFGLGLVILAVSRPFEGAVLSASFGVILVATALRPGVLPMAQAMSRFWLPVGACLAALAVLLAIYNAAITGSPWLMPYVLYTAQHDTAPLFLWQSLPHRPPLYEHAMFRHIADWEQVKYTQARTIDGFLGEAGDRLGLLFYRLIAPENLLLICSLALPATLVGSRRGRFLAGIVGISLLALLSETYAQPHYAAPVLPVVLALLVPCLRRVNAFRFSGRRAGRMLVSLGLVIAVATVPFTRDAPMGWALERQAIEASLETRPGKHLVIVRYSPSHDSQFDWVHNGADIDGARIVWARDRNDGDQALIDYYRDRSAWLLEVDAPDPVPVPYETAHEARQSRAAGSGAQPD